MHGSSETVRAEAEQAKREIAALAAAVRRAQSSLVDPSICGECWVDHGELNQFIAAKPGGSGAGGSGEDVPRCRRGHAKYRR